jgi:molybdopterin adenylyltransferase
VIRAGLLCVPELDADTLSAVRAVLRAAQANVVVLQESGVGMQRAWIAETLRRWCDEEEMDLVLTIGGTLPAPGPSAAECVPEATLEVLDRLMPGLPEAMRAEAQASAPLALLDRGVAGIRSRTLIVNLPAGSLAPLFLEAIADLLPAAVAYLQEAPPASPPPAPEPAAHKPLDPDEFAAFLNRPKP